MDTTSRASDQPVANLVVEQSFGRPANHLGRCTLKHGDVYFAARLFSSAVSAIAYGITGAEFFGMLGAEIRSPERTVKPTIWLATTFVAIFHEAATLALVVLLKPETISEIRGLADAGEAAARVFAVPSISPLIGLFLLMQAFGAFGGGGAAVSRMPFAAGAARLLPDAFGRLHPYWHTPHVAWLTLGLVASGLLLLFQLGDVMRVAYQEMVSLTFIGGFLPYIYLFMGAWKAKRKVAASVGASVSRSFVWCAASCLQRRSRMFGCSKRNWPWEQ